MSSSVVVYHIHYYVNQLGGLSILSHWAKVHQATLSFTHNNRSIENVWNNHVHTNVDDKGFVKNDTEGIKHCH